jgi:hypothetical protein
MDPHLMTQLRMNCIRNSNLAEVFDLLRLSTLMREFLVPVAVKPKADVVEAMIGEMAEYDEESTALNELIAYIAYVGEKAYFVAQAQPTRSKEAEKSRLYTPSLSRERKVASSAVAVHSAPSSQAKKPRRKSDESVAVQRQRATKPALYLVSARQNPPKELELNSAPTDPKSLFYVPTYVRKSSEAETAKESPKDSRSRPVDGQKATPEKSSLAGSVPEVTPPFTKNPDVVVRQYEKGPCAKPSPKPDISSKVAQTLMEQYRKGEMKILQRPISLANASQKVTYEYR